MQLVIDLRILEKSGRGTYLQNIVPFVIQKYPNTILLGNKKIIQKYLWAISVKIIHFDAKPNSIKEQLWYPFVIPACDILWCPHFNIPILPTKAKQIICTIYDMRLVATNWHFLKRLLARILFQNVVWRSKGIITISKFTKQEIIKYTNCKKSKINTIPLGVDTSLFQISSSFTNPYKFKYILFVGNISPNKNLICLLKAYLSLEESLQRIYKILLVGEKKLNKTAKDYYIDIFIKKHKLEEKIIFTGAISNKQLIEIYQYATVFVFPSIYEGFGLPILEAMSMQIPVISSNASCLPEVGGQAVLYFDPLDSQELAYQLTYLLNNPNSQKHLINKGLERIKKFNWQTTIDKHIHFFESFNNSNNN